MFINNVVIGGYSTADPELESFNDGSKRLEFIVAINRKYKTRTLEEREEVSFISVVTYDTTAWNCSKYLHKGSPVVVIGRIKQDRWQDKETGKNRSKTKVVAENVQFVGSKPVEENHGG